MALTAELGKEGVHGGTMGSPMLKGALEWR
jgi:hypothetical protein